MKRYTSKEKILRDLDISLDKISSMTKEVSDLNAKLLIDNIRELTRTEISSIYHSINIIEQAIWRQKVRARKLGKALSEFQTQVLFPEACDGSVKPK